jgi:hypothetical protein
LQGSPRTKQRAGQIFRYAIATGRAERDPTADLRGALAPIVATNHAASEDVYQEADVPKDRSRPLEWRRSFNHVAFKLTKVRPNTSFSINDTDWDAEDGAIKISRWQEVKPAPAIIYTIDAVAEHDAQNDSIYSFTKTDTDDVFGVERPPSPMRIRLVGKAPMQGHKKIPDGVFPGHLFRVDYNPNGDDYLCLEAHLPTEHAPELHRALKANPTLQLSVSVHLLSFSYEVDDALREAHHSRALIIESMALAPLHSVSIRQGDAGPSSPESRNDSDTDEIEEDSPLVDANPTIMMLETLKTIASSLRC